MNVRFWYEIHVRVYTKTQYQRSFLDSFLLFLKYRRAFLVNKRGKNNTRDVKIGIPDDMLANFCRFKPSRNPEPSRIPNTGNAKIDHLAQFFPLCIPKAIASTKIATIIGRNLFLVVPHYLFD